MHPRPLIRVTVSPRLARFLIAAGARPAHAADNYEVVLQHGNDTPILDPRRPPVAYDTRQDPAAATLSHEDWGTTLFARGLVRVRRIAVAQIPALAIPRQRTSTENSQDPLATTEPAVPPMLEAWIRETLKHVPRDRRDAFDGLEGALRALQGNIGTAAGIVEVLTDLLEIPLDLRDVDLSDQADLQVRSAVLVSATWNSRTTWPEGFDVEWVKANSREVQPGVFQVVDRHEWAASVSS